MLLLLSSAIAAPPAWNLCPFGVGVYLHDRPARGVLYTATQVLGWTALGVASWQGSQYNEVDDPADYYRWETVGAIGASVGFGSWIVSAVDGGRLHELEVEGNAARLRAWDQQLIAARGSGDD